jgi:hypothetical protein
MNVKNFAGPVLMSLFGMGITTGTGKISRVSPPPKKV